ncbi:unnamed protein product [Mytilus edulis]|uniref:Uncharacterized protein n=1 Tax=Mytilus edulis TaxID=6550 RepID=A0A8S3TGP0_MYTED|nr:unnamed protein product [Mytilus edulis]
MAQSQPLPPETTVTHEHKMTEKGKELYHSHKIKYLKQIDGSWETIENLLEELSECSKELKPLRKLEKNILKSREKYCENSNQYIEFLTRKNNEDSNEALPTFKTEFKKCNEIIDNTLQQIKTLKLTAAETMSVVPVESVRSNNSGKSGSISSSAMARKRVNAEVQRTKLQYAEQQTKLIKQKARLSELETQSKALKDREKAEVDADLALLKQQTEAAVAEVEVKVLEEAESDRRSLSLQEDKESLQKVKMTLTEKYVNEQFNEVEQLKSQDKNNNVPQDIPNNQDKFSSHTPAPRNQLNIIPTPRNLPKFQVDDLDRSIVEDIKPEIRQKQTLNPYAADFELTQPPLPPNHDQSVVSDLTNCPDGGEKSSDTTQNANDQTVSSKCTFLCGFSGKSCGKTVQVRVYPKNFPDKAVNVYAILDDQSNRTLAKTELFDQLGINTSAIQYTMSSCAGRTIMNGRCAESLIVESLSGNGELEIHSVIECSAIPDEKSEIPTPDIAKSYPHLREIAHQMLDLNPNIDIQLLIGRDVPEAHHVFRQLTGPKGTPFAQELFFGWVIIGDVCLGKVHKPNFVNVNKTNVMNNGRGTIFEPCINTLYVKENTELAHIRDNVHSQRCNNDPLFIKTKDDDKIGTSVQDRLFLNLMDSEFKKDSNGHWTAPLPFRPNRQRLPNNRSQAWKRAQILDKSFQQNFTKKTHFVEFMQKVLVSGAAETRRFHTYVSNRIERILSVSSSNQWQFVPTHLNPSDCGTRYSISVDMENNPWLLGPKWMKNSDEEAQCDVKILYPLVSPDNDKEIRKEISASKTSIDALAPIVGRFKKFSSWRRLVKAISFLQHVAQSFSLKDKSCQGMSEGSIFARDRMFG